MLGTPAFGPSLSPFHLTCMQSSSGLKGHGMSCWSYMNHVTLHTPSCFSSRLPRGYAPTSQESQPLPSCLLDSAPSLFQLP